MVSGTPPPMRFATHVMADVLSRMQPCETAVPSAPEMLFVPWMPIWPGPPSNSWKTLDRALVARAKGLAGVLGGQREGLLDEELATGGRRRGLAHDGPEAAFDAAVAVDGDAGGRKA